MVQKYSALENRQTTDNYHSFIAEWSRGREGHTLMNPYKKNNQNFPQERSFANETRTKRWRNGEGRGREGDIKTYVMHMYQLPTVNVIIMFCKLILIK